MPDSNEILIILVTVLIVVGLYYFVYAKNKVVVSDVSTIVKNPSLQLQAYERMILLVDRISLANLISRTPANGLTARELQVVLTRNIRDEFDYNITQQIYIHPEAWKAVRNLKENNLLVINQVAGNLPIHASGLELSRAVMEFTLTDSKSNLPELVSEALSFEAKKLM